MAFFVKKHKSCCGCISLKTGTMIILWLFLVTSVFQLHGDIDSLYDFHDYVSNFKIKTTFSAFVEWTFWSMIIFALLFNLIPYVSAMYGAYMRKAAYLQPFILLNAVSIVNLISVLVFVVITFVIVCVNRPGLENDITEFLKENPQISKDYSIPNDASATILTAILTACIIVFAMISVSTVILYHFTCVVHSYYLKLKEEKEDYKYNMFRSPSEKKEPLA